jgi:hypothetical protein
LRITVWTGDPRDTRPTAVIGQVNIPQCGSILGLREGLTDPQQSDILRLFLGLGNRMHFRQWKRREVITLLGGAATRCLTARDARAAGDARPVHPPVHLGRNRGMLAPCRSRQSVTMQLTF